MIEWSDLVTNKGTLIGLSDFFYCLSSFFKGLETMLYLKDLSQGRMRLGHVGVSFSGLQARALT